MDETALVAVTESAVKWRRLDINQLVYEQWVIRGADRQGTFDARGDLQAKKAPMVAFLAMPLYALAGLLGMRQVMAALLLNALVVACTAAVVRRFARRLGFDEPVAIAAALVYGLATSAPVYAKTLFAEPVSGLGLLLGAEAVFRARGEPGLGARSMLAGGAGLFMAMLANPVNGVFALGILAALLVPGGPRRWRNSLVLAGAFVAGLAGLAAWNLARFGNAFTTGYHFAEGEGFGAPLWDTVPALLLSPWRGLLFYVPASLLAVAGARAMVRRNPFAGALLVALAASHVLVYSAWWTWYGGWCFGPRFLVPAMPLLALLALPVLETARARAGRTRLAVALVLALSAGVQALGVAVGFDEYEMELTRPGRDDLGTPLERRWNPALSPIVGHARLLLAGVTDLAWRDQGRVDWLLAAPLGALALGLGALLALSIRGRGPAERRATKLAAVAACAAATLLYALRGRPPHARHVPPTADGAEALELVASRAKAGDGTLLARHLVPLEMDAFPRFPDVVGLPEERLVRGDDRELARVLGNASRRHRRLWLVVDRREEVAAAVSRALEGRPAIWGARAGPYGVVLFDAPTR